MHHPASLTAKTSRSASAKSTKIVKTKERYELLSGCKFCGKSKTAIKKAMKEGTPEEKKKKREYWEKLMKLKEEMDGG